MLLRCALEALAWQKAALVAGSVDREAVFVCIGSEYVRASAWTSDKALLRAAAECFGWLTKLAAVLTLAANRQAKVRSCL